MGGENMAKTKITNYFQKILEKSMKYLKETFSDDEINDLIHQCQHLNQLKKHDEIVSKWTEIYISNVKRKYQKEHEYDDDIASFVEHNQPEKVKVIWGDCLNVLKSLKSESVHLMVTSPPYYNAREYSHWDDLKKYLEDMRAIIKEAYRVLDNHRVFVWNVGDIFDNDNLFTKSTWGKRRIPLGAYFISIFEEEGFTFVDDYIWDKGEVQSQRHKNGNKPYPFYQYPMNCYEHILIFHKHRTDYTRYPCPVCGCLQVNGNAYSEIGHKSWECKNQECFERSEANRGKRFSVKSILTQSRQSNEFEIEEDFIKKWRRDVIKISPVIKINSKGENTLGHTAPFPEEIPEMAIKFFSYPGEIVMDPFGGSMTTPIVASKLNRNGVGVELNKNMFEDSIRKNITNKLGIDKMEEFEYE
ncbi:MAG: site-specific DNA-methyltransferase [Ruminococcaceae bacterium]|nr:site-specific DNA-methyltransferase [Oscillospiraceae bacterium]